MTATRYGRSVAMRHASTGEVRVLAEGAPELARLRRERDTLRASRPRWEQVAMPTKSRRA